MTRRNTPGDRSPSSDVRRRTRAHVGVHAAGSPPAGQSARIARMKGHALVWLLTALPAIAAGQDRVAPGALPQADRPFGTLREQAAMQQQWLKKRLDTFLPALMRTHGIDMWVVPMREYNEDPVFSSLVSPQTFAARRRTIYVFFDKCAAAGGAPAPAIAQRIARVGA